MHRPSAPKQLQLGACKNETDAYRGRSWRRNPSGRNDRAHSAQDNKDRTVEQYSCKDIMRESGANRDVAIAFLRGFMLGKSGSTKFNLDVLHKQSDDFIERCLANPDEKAMDAMAKIIG